MLITAALLEPDLRQPTFSCPFRCVARRTGRSFARDSGATLGTSRRKATRQQPGSVCTNLAQPFRRCCPKPSTRHALTSSCGKLAHGYCEAFMCRPYLCKAGHALMLQCCRRNDRGTQRTIRGQVVCATLDADQLLRRCTCTSPSSGRKCAKSLSRLLGARHP